MEVTLPPLSRSFLPSARMISSCSACSSSSSSPGFLVTATSHDFANHDIAPAGCKGAFFPDTRWRSATLCSPCSRKDVNFHKLENWRKCTNTRGFQTYARTKKGDSWSSESQSSIRNQISRFQDAFWRFLRPHTIRGTIIGTLAVVTRALIDNSHLIDWGLLPKALRGLLALLCGNGYIVGINQIYDIGIDKVNKPFLPVAAGDLSVPAAWVLVISLALLGIIIVATNFGPLISSLYSLGLFLGAIYSVPPLRLKRFAIAAFLIIATVRGFLLNFGVYYATRSSLGLTYAWSPPILFITSFVTIFATVIAITKDLADVEGDRKFQISTFATRLGVRNIAFLGSGLLLLNYLGAIIAAYVFPEAFRKAVMAVGHAILAAALIYQTWLLDASKYSKEAIAVYYRFVWNLFYAEYIMFPFI